MAEDIALAFIIADGIDDLVMALGPFHMYRQHTKLPLSKSVLACLWTLANQESYRGVADRFNISKSTVFAHLHHFCSLVITHLSHYISWPTGEQLHTSQLGFQRAGFPNTVCAIDGCHIPIVRPNCNDPTAYYNRKQFYSIILTGFANSNRRFCHVSVGHPGSWHDARAFCHTTVAHLLEEDPQALVPNGMHIIGDSAYPLLPQLMKPYRDNGHLTTSQRHFNRKLNVARFRRLKCLHMKGIGHVSATVTACCLLQKLVCPVWPMRDQVALRVQQVMTEPLKDGLL
uniref:DDE Tnp4 domain-containing protein n=1 Tax=Nothobranchius furzeri TaxID=105023 RepID=A0A8C6KUR7_NOTFU